MPLVRTYSKIDEEGRIHLPSNVRRMTGIAPGERVEIRLQGPHQRPWIVIHRRASSHSPVGLSVAATPVARC